MKTILLVEDNENNQLLIEDIFRKRKKEYRLEMISDAREAFTTIETRQPDLILLDMRLPHISGWEIAKQLKQHSKTCSIPIIAVTAHAMKGDEEKAKDAGCDDFVTKPVKRDVLLHKVDQWVGSNQ